MKKLFIITGIFCAMILSSCMKTYTCQDSVGSTVGTYKGTAKGAKKFEKDCNCTCTPNP